MILIGTDAPAAYIPLEVRSDVHQPYAIRLRLGWAIRGPVQRLTNLKFSTNKVSINFGESRDVVLQRN